MVGPPQTAQCPNSRMRSILQSLWIRNPDAYRETMKFTYDTETDSISSPDLDAQQTAAIQSLLSSALYRNDHVQDVVKLLLQTTQSARE